MRVRKAEIDKEVAVLLGRGLMTVKSITSVFLRSVMAHLVDMNEVSLDGLGVIRVWIQPGPGKTKMRNGKSFVMVDAKKKYHVSFKKARPFGEAIQARHGRASEKLEDESWRSTASTKRAPSKKKSPSKGAPNAGRRLRSTGTS